MAEISGLREQILANYGFMGQAQSVSDVDVVVRYVHQKYYRATIADKSTGQDVCDEAHNARTIETALKSLLTYTCELLAHPPNMLGTGSSQAQASPTVKRGRGRPKSTLAAPTPSVVKPLAKGAAPAARPMVVAQVKPDGLATRGRGRPRKADAAPTAPVVAPDAVSTIKRGRGRPRKNAAVAIPEDTEQYQQDVSVPAKHGRGRPKKVDSTPVAAKPKRGVSALEEEETGANKSRKITSDEELQDRISADELGDEAGQAAPLSFQTPQVWFPTYVSRIARNIYHSVADHGADRGLTEDEIMIRTGLSMEDVITGVRQLNEKGGIINVATEADEMKWTVLDEWEDEDE
ncbi:hypothetical protein E4T43_04800 [Aureobasidium subglaciale]|nr:hypothetical protein E4T43_04800 [Aureobasidium subglaciale]